MFRAQHCKALCSVLLIMSINNQPTHLQQPLAVIFMVICGAIFISTKKNSFKYFNIQQISRLIFIFTPYITMLSYLHSLVAVFILFFLCFIYFDKSIQNFNIIYWTLHENKYLLIGVRQNISASLNKIFDRNFKTIQYFTSKITKVSKNEPSVLSDNKTALDKQTKSKILLVHSLSHCYHKKLNGLPPKLFK